MKADLKVLPNIQSAELLFGDQHVNLKKEILSPGQGEYWHFHKHKYQVFYCIKGSVTISLADSITELKPGMSIHIPALRTHSVWNTSDEDTHFYLFSTGDDALPDKCNIDLKPVNPNSLFFMREDYVIEPLKVDDLQEFSSLILANEIRLTDFPKTINATKAKQLNPDFYNEKQLYPYLIKQGINIIGYIGLKNIKAFDRSVELGYWIDQKYEGKGIFRSLLSGFIKQLLITGAFRNIEVSLKSSNYRNIKLLEALGFNLYQKRELLIYKTSGRDFLSRFGNIEIIEYKAQFKQVFRQLNFDWISEHFLLEPGDFEVLDYPEENIIAQGGNVFFVLVDNEAVTTCALKRINDDSIELIKMATNPVFRGLGLGDLLLERVLEWARGHFYKQVELYTQSSLFQALKLYKRYGFVECPIEPGHYKRADMKMKLFLD